jgi:signal transduction histidine kinase
VLAAITETTEAVLRARRLETLSALGLEVAKARTLRTACSAAVRVLGRNRHDVPFAALYLVHERQTASLVATTGLPIQHPLPASVADTGEGGGPWSLAGVLQARRLTELDGIDADGPPLAGHPWPEPVRRAIALPIVTPRDAPIAMLVAGVGPRRRWNGGYRAFFEQIGGQLGASLCLAKACEDERRRADGLAEADRVKTAFFSNVSHELRAPLRMLLGASADPALGSSDLEATQQQLRRVGALLDFVGAEEDPARGSDGPADLSAPLSPRDTAVDVAADAPAPGATQIVSEAMQWLHAPLPAPTPEEAAIDRHVHILVVDDSADMSTYLRRLLSKRWTVDCVPDGQAALAAIRERRPSIVLTDVIMPNLDGFGLLRALRADPSTATLPVIMLSARTGERAETGLEAGADDYIVKPFSARELVARVAARLELHRLGTRLAQERAAIAEVFRQTPVPVCMLRGRDLVYESANDAYLAAFDLDVRGKSLYDATPDLARQFGVALHEVMDSGRPFVGREVSVQLRRHGRVEETYWTMLFAQLPGGSDEKYVVCICNEVTEQVVGRKRFEEMAERADAANRTKDDFLAMLGHELRNPLSPIVTSLQLMRMRDIHSPEQDIVERQVNHLRRLVDDLLDVSRIARGKIELRRERIEVAAVLAAAIETTSPLFEQRLHRIEVDVPQAGLAIDVDPSRMAQVFSNLMTNAVKYSEPGSRIAVEARRVGERVRVRVVDEGAGIAAEMIDKVFDMFVQQPQTLERSRGGLGLGLSIVKSLVELHGGTVSARSDGVGHGTELTVELPAAIGPERTQPALEPMLIPGGAVKRILVVDDNDDAALSLKKALERLGYSVAIAHDGPAALRAAAVFEPEIALLDIGLPVMDGYELGRRLLALRRVHLVALSGYGQEADRRRSAEAGFEVHLTKPVDLRHLESVMRSLA